jgi:hypothetical protein
MVVFSLLKFAICTVIRRAKQVVRCRQECLDVETLLVHMVTYLEKRLFAEVATSPALEQALVDVYDAVGVADSAVRMCFDDSFGCLMKKAGDASASVKQAFTRLQNAYMALSMTIDVENVITQSDMLSSIAELRKEFEDMQKQMRSERQFRKCPRIENSAFSEGDVVLLFHDGTVAKTSDCCAVVEDVMFWGQVKHPLVVAQDSGVDVPNVWCVERGRCVAVLDHSCRTPEDVHHGDWLALSQVANGMKSGGARVARYWSDCVLGKAVSDANMPEGSHAASIFRRGHFLFAVLDLYEDCKPGSVWSDVCEETELSVRYAYAKKVSQDRSVLSGAKIFAKPGARRLTCFLAPDVPFSILTAGFSQLCQYMGLKVRFSEMWNPEATAQTSASSQPAVRGNLFAGMRGCVLGMVHADDYLPGREATLCTMTLTIFAQLNGDGDCSFSIVGQMDVTIQQRSPVDFNSVNKVHQSIVSMAYPDDARDCSGFDDYCNVISDVFSTLGLFILVTGGNSSLASLLSGSAQSQHAAKAEWYSGPAPFVQDSKLFTFAVKESQSIQNFNIRTVADRDLLGELVRVLLRLVAPVSLDAFLTAPIFHARSLSLSYTEARAALINVEYQRYCAKWAAHVCECCSQLENRYSTAWKQLTSIAPEIAKRFDCLPGMTSSFRNWIESMKEEAVASVRLPVLSELFRVQSTLLNDMNADLRWAIEERRITGITMSNTMMRGYRMFLKECASALVQAFGHFLREVHGLPAGSKVQDAKVRQSLEKALAGVPLDVGDETLPNVPLCDFTCVAVDSFPITGKLYLTSRDLFFKSSVPLVGKKVHIPFKHVLDVSIEYRSMLPDVVTVFAARESDQDAVEKGRLTQAHRSTLVSLGRTTVFSHSFQHFDAFRVKSWDIQTMILLLVLSVRGASTNSSVCRQISLRLETLLTTASTDPANPLTETNSKEEGLKWDPLNVVCASANKPPVSLVGKGSVSADDDAAEDGSVPNGAPKTREVFHEPACALADGALASHCGNSSRQCDAMSFRTAAIVLRAQLVYMFESGKRLSKYALSTSLPNASQPESLILVEYEAAEATHMSVLRALQRQDADRISIPLQDIVALELANTFTSKGTRAEFLQRFGLCESHWQTEIANSCFSVFAKGGTRYDLRFLGCNGSASSAQQLMDSLRYWMQ